MEFSSKQQHRNGVPAVNASALSCFEVRCAMSWMMLKRTATLPQKKAGPLVNVWRSHRNGVIIDSISRNWNVECNPSITMLMEVGQWRSTTSSVLEFLSVCFFRYLVVH